MALDSNLVFITYVWQIFNLMSKVVLMFMLPLTSMLKLNVLRGTTNTMLNNMVCRLVAIVELSLFVKISFSQVNLCL